LLFGGRNHESAQDFNAIHHYDITGNIWTYLQAQMPIDNEVNYAATTALNESYVVFFGGWHQKKYLYSDTIFMFELSTHKFLKSEIKCPKASIYRAITKRNKEMDVLLVNGFVRKYCQSMNNISDDLLMLLQSWYCTEMIYLLDINDQHHFKVLSSDLFVGLTPM